MAERNVDALHVFVSRSPPLIAVSSSIHWLPRLKSDPELGHSAHSKPIGKRFGDHSPGRAARTSAVFVFQLLRGAAAARDSGGAGFCCGSGSGVESSCGTWLVDHETLGWWFEALHPQMLAVFLRGLDSSNQPLHIKGK